MEAMTHHATPDSPWDYIVTTMFPPYPQTTELWGEAQYMDAPPLCTLEDMEYTTTNQDIPSPTKVSDQLQGMPILILHPPSMPILLS